MSFVLLFLSQLFHFIWEKVERVSILSCSSHLEVQRYLCNRILKTEMFREHIKLLKMYLMSSSDDFSWSLYTLKSEWLIDLKSWENLESLVHLTSKIFFFLFFSYTKVSWLCVTCYRQWTVSTEIVYWRVVLVNIGLISLWQW